MDGYKKDWTVDLDKDWFKLAQDEVNYAIYSAKLYQRAYRDGYQAALDKLKEMWDNGYTIEDRYGDSGSEDFHRLLKKVKEK